MTGDMQILNEHLYGTVTLKTEDRATSTHDFTIKPGELVDKGVTGAVAASGNFAVLQLTAGPKDGTNLFMGLCKEESDETASVNGHGVFYMIGLGSRIKGRATTASNIDTIAKLDALVLDNVVTTGIAAKGDDPVVTPYTIDEDAGDDPNVNGLQILTGDIENGFLEVRVVAGTAMLGNGI